MKGKKRFQVKKYCCVVKSICDAILCIAYFSLTPFQCPEHSPWKAPCSNSCPEFICCTQNNFTTVLFCLDCRRKNPHVALKMSHIAGFNQYHFQISMMKKKTNEGSRFECQKTIMIVPIYVTEGRLR